jgi:hypothetical protein
MNHNKKYRPPDEFAVKYGLVSGSGGRKPVATA